MKIVSSLQALAEFALAAPDVEPLAVYDCVKSIADSLLTSAANDWPMEHRRQLLELHDAAYGAAEALCNADKMQLQFRALLGDTASGSLSLGGAK